MSPARVLRRAACVAVFVVLLTATAASAHIEASPSKVAVGKNATVGLLIEHGCSGSPTTGVEIQAPKQAKNARIEPPAGWTAKASGATLTASGTPMAADREFTVDVAFKAPASKQTLVWKLVQQCQSGSTPWIEVQQKGAPEPEFPAPVVKVVSAKQAGQAGADDHHG